MCALKKKTYSWNQPLVMSQRVLMPLPGLAKTEPANRMTAKYAVFDTLSDQTTKYNNNMSGDCKQGAKCTPFSSLVFEQCSAEIRQQAAPQIWCVSGVLHRRIALSINGLFRWSADLQFALITHLWLWGKSWRWAGLWPSWRQTPRTRPSLWPRWGRAHWRRRTPLGGKQGGREDEGNQGHFLSDCVVEEETWDSSRGSHTQSVKASVKHKQGCTDATFLQNKFEYLHQHSYWVLHMAIIGVALMLVPQMFCNVTNSTVSMSFEYTTDCHKFHASTNTNGTQLSHPNTYNWFRCCGVHE